MSSEVGAKPIFDLWDTTIESKSKTLQTEKSKITELFQKAVGEPLTIATHFSSGKIYESDVTDLKGLATANKNPQDALKLCNSLWKLLDAAGKVKRAKTEISAFKAAESQAKTKLAETLAECPLSDIISQVDNEDLFIKLINKKYATSAPSFEEIKMILQKFKENEFKMKSLAVISNLKAPIEKLSTSQFLKIVDTLIHINKPERLTEKFYNEIDKLVQEMLFKCGTIEEQLEILNTYPRTEKQLDICQRFVLYAKCNTTEDWMKAAEYIGKYPVDDSSLKDLFLEKFLANHKDAKFPLASCIDVCKLCGNTDHLSLEDLPLIIRAYPNVRESGLLENADIKGLLLSEEPEVRQDAATMLALRDPTILNELFEEGSELDKFTAEDKLTILAKVISQTDKLDEFKEETPLFDLLQENLTEAFDQSEIPPEGKLLRQALCSRDLSLFNKLADNCMAIELVSLTEKTPGDFALLKDTGEVSTFKFSDSIAAWSGNQLEEYLRELFKNPETRDLFFIRLDAGSFDKLPGKRRAQIILDNLDKIPLQMAVDNLKLLKAKEFSAEGSLLLGVFQCYNLENIKGTTSAENEKAIALIEREIETDPQLKPLFAEFKKGILSAPKKGAESSGEESAVSSYNVAKALIAFAHFTEKYQHLDSPAKENVGEMLSSAIGKKVLRTVLTIRKPDHGRFFLANRYIENASKNRSEFFSYSSSSGFAESVALEMSTMFTDINPKKLLFWSEEELKGGKDLIYETIEAMELVNQQPTFTEEDKKYLFSFITGAAPALEEGFSKETKSKMTGEVLNILRAGGAGFLRKEYLQTHYSGDHVKLMQNISGMCLQQVLEGKLDESTLEKVVEKLNNSRESSMIITIASKLKDLDVETKERHLDALVDILKDYALGTHKETRFSKSPHLQALAAKLEEESSAGFTVDQWKNAAFEKSVEAVTNKKDSQTSSYKVFVTDDLTDISELGTEVVGSCLNFKTGQAKDVGTIMGFSGDGKTRLMAIKKDNKDEEPLQGRLILKLLWDDVAKTPVIFAEGMRTAMPEEQDVAQEILPALYKGAVEFATQLNLPIVGWGNGWGTYGGELKGYSNPISSLAPNRNPSEKCDAADTEGVNAGGKGEYTLPSTNLKTLWEPSV